VYAAPAVVVFTDAVTLGADAKAVANVTVWVVAVPTVVASVKVDVVPDTDFANAVSTDDASAPKWLSSGAMLSLAVG